MGKKLDLSKNLHYIRWQSGEGCWGFARLAAWDIMNEIACPFSPNLSLNVPLALHRRRSCADGFDTLKGIYTPNGRWLPWSGQDQHLVLESGVGLSTEGTEITCATGRWTGKWSTEGFNEANNYRMLPGNNSIDIENIALKAKVLVKWLDKGHPIVLSCDTDDSGHAVAVVGYDSDKKEFKIVNSLGDQWKTGGFDKWSFAHVESLRGGRAQVFSIIEPRPVPAARIRVTTPKSGGRRCNINLWLSAEDSPRPKRKIWPPVDTRDPSRLLHYTVRLPSEFVWPPAPDNRVVLDLFDSGEFTEVGGALEEFTVAFGGEIYKCSQLRHGSVAFSVHEHKQVHIP